MPGLIKGPALFLAQFAGDEAPYNSLQNITKWAAGLGYKGVQIPTFDTRLFDLEKAAQSDAYCDEVKGICADAGVQITELSTHLQGQLVAVNPAYDLAFDAFAPASVHGNPAARQAWAVDQVTKTAIASRRLGLRNTHLAAFGGVAIGLDDGDRALDLRLDEIFPGVVQQIRLLRNARNDEDGAHGNAKGNEE